MAGYTPLFSTLTTGTLCGKWPDIGLWPIVLSMADKNGVVDCTQAYIAGVTGLALEEVRACMRRFCEPDPGSRSDEYSGARLVLIDDHRDWGWRVVNHGVYREKARKAAQQTEATESGRDAERKRAARAAHKDVTLDVQSRPAMSGADRPSDADADADAVGVGAQPKAAPSLTLNGSSDQNGKGRGKGTRIPEDWQPEMAGLDVPSDFDPRLEADKFRDYWKARAGAGGVKLDWAATWRNWVRRAVSDGGYARRARSGTSGVGPNLLA